MLPLLSLDQFVFSLPTLAFDQLQRKRDWRHPRSARIGARDATQFTGPGEDSLSIAGTAHAEFCDGRASLDQLIAMAATGEPFELVDGLGYLHGSFVIVSIDERAQHFYPDGTPRAIEFGIDLQGVDAVAPA